MLFLIDTCIGVNAPIIYETIYLLIFIYIKILYLDFTSTQIMLSSFSPYFVGFSTNF